MPHERLRKRLADLLDGSLGLNIFPSSFALAWRFGQPAQFWKNPYLAGFRVGLLYALLFCGIPWALYSIPYLELSKPSWPLFFLQIYGSFWSGWSTTTTRITSSSISTIIESDIIPELSVGTAETIYQDIMYRFERRRLLGVAWGIAILSAALSGCLVYRDVSTISEPSIGEVIWWAAGWAILFATAAKVVNVARFYRVFAAHLENDPGKLYALDPARSTLVISVASVAQRMLLFWFGIAVSIALVIPFGVKDWCGREPLNLSNIDLSHNWFVLVDVLVTGFFSIGFGTIVFLQSEAAIRRAVKKVTHSTLRLIKTKVADLSDRLGDLDEAEWKRLTELNSLHNEVATAGSYRSFIISGLSVLVPFVIPLASLFFRK